MSPPDDSNCGRPAHKLMKRVLNAASPSSDTNASQLLCYGYPEDDASYTGNDIGKFLEKVSRIPVSEIYKDALDRWKKETQGPAEFKSQTMQIAGRLFHGLGEASVYGTWITLHPIYGVPFISGSSLKGLVRAYTKCCELSENAQLNKRAREILFGKEGDRPEEFASGYLIFHDAWWDTGELPMTSEVITPHHQAYYGTGGKRDATDFDSPIPSPHLAVQGSFYFVIEGEGGWAEYGFEVLKKALDEMGAGGRTRSGYGRIVSETAVTEQEGATT